MTYPSISSPQFDFKVIANFRKVDFSEHDFYFQKSRIFFKVYESGF